jgi:hypothetical protein
MVVIEDIRQKLHENYNYYFNYVEDGSCNMMVIIVG